jgi:hypothetical protein
LVFTFPGDDLDEVSSLDVHGLFPIEILTEHLTEWRGVSQTAYAAHISHSRDD